MTNVKTHKIFKLFELPHTGLSIFQLKILYLREFKLKDNIMSFSFDNASNNTPIIHMLKEI